MTINSQLSKVQQFISTQQNNYERDLKTFVEIPSVSVDPAHRADIVEMEHMLDEYLEFARGEGGEPDSMADLAEVAREAVTAAAGAPKVFIRPDIA